MAVTEELNPTPVASSDGLVLTTIGGVVSDGGATVAVVNDQLLVPVIALPAVSLTAVVMAAVKVVESASDEEGLNVAVFPSELSDTAPDILLVPCFNVKDELVTVEL